MSTVEILVGVLFSPSGMVNITGEWECFVTTARIRQQNVRNSINSVNHPGTSISTYSWIRIFVFYHTKSDFMNFPLIWTHASFPAPSSTNLGVIITKALIISKQQLPILIEKTNRKDRHSKTKICQTKSFQGEIRSQRNNLLSENNANITYQKKVT